MVDHKRIAELDRYASRFVQERRPDFCGDSRLEWIVEVHDDQSTIAEDVSERSGNRNAACTIQLPFRIKGQRTFEEIICGIAVEQRSHTRTLTLEIRVANDHQTFVFIRNIKEAVHQMDGLLFVLLAMRPQRIHSQSCRRRNRHGISGRQVEALSQRRNRSRHHALRNIFVIEIRDVEDAQSTLAHGGVKILAARLQIENLCSRVMVRFFQHAPAVDMLFVVIRIRNLLEIASDHCGRFVVFGNGHGFVSLVASGDKNVASHEIHEVRALQQQLRHPGVVVVGARNVTIRAPLGLFSTHRMGNECTESLSTEAFGRNGLLLVVEPVAIAILRTHQYCARGTDRRDTISCHRAVDAERIDIVAENLEVVRRPVACRQAFVVQHGGALVGGHRKMAAITGRRPRGMTGVTGHAAVLVRELGFILR